MEELVRGRPPGEAGTLRGFGDSLLGTAGSLLATWGRSARHAGVLVLGVGALASCDKDVPGRGAGSVGVASAEPTASPPAIPRMSNAELTAMREAVRKDLEQELRPEVRAELERELRPIVKAELAAELRTGQAAPSEQPDAGPSAPPPTPDVKGDVWSTPGTKIWPSAGGLKLVELVVGTTLEDKLPADVKLHYPTTPEILYCYTVFENPLPDATVTHVWRRGSRLVSRVELQVGTSPKWRTWSKQRTQPHWTGLWSCEVLGDDGRQLGLTVFQIGG